MKPKVFIFKSHPAPIAETPDLMRGRRKSSLFYREFSHIEGARYFVPHDNNDVALRHVKGKFFTLLEKETKGTSFKLYKVRLDDGGTTYLCI
jgi:hypothetical protein